MTTYLISLSLNPIYYPLNKIKEIGMLFPINDSTYLISTSASVVELRDYIREINGVNSVFVTSLGNSAAWSNIGTSNQIVKDLYSKIV